MTLRFIVSVQDYHVCACFAKTVRQRAFRNLAAARRYEAKFYKKARRKAPQGWGKIDHWGSTAHNFVNGGNGSTIHEFAGWNPTRTITITCRS